jgi:DNA-directed RNA polymerase subunit K/omega
MSDDEAYVSSDGSGSDNEADESTGTPLGEPDLTPSAQLVDIKSLKKRLKANDTDTGQPFIMTKYEYTRIKGERLQQLNGGCIPFVSYSTDDDTIESIFKREFVLGKLPLVVERKLPDGKSKYIKIRQFSNRDSEVFD